MILSTETKADIRRLHDIWLARLAFEYRCEQTDIAAAIQYEPEKRAVRSGDSQRKEAPAQPPSDPTGEAMRADQSSLHEQAGGPIHENAEATPQAGEASPHVSPAPNQDQPSMEPAPAHADPASEPPHTGSDKTGGGTPPSPPVAPKRRKGMADEVVRLHREHPSWNRLQIAAALGCIPEYVASTAKRRGLILPGLSRGADSGITARIRQVAADNPDWRDAQVAHEVGRSQAQVRMALKRASAPASEPASPSAPLALENPISPEETVMPITGLEGARIKRPAAGSLFWLRHPDGRYLHCMVHVLTASRKEAWTGTAAQVEGCRRSYEIARDLKDTPVEGEQAR